MSTNKEGTSVTGSTGSSQTTPSTLTPDTKDTIARGSSKGKGSRGFGRGSGRRPGRGTQNEAEEKRTYELSDISFRLGPGAANHYVTNRKRFEIYAGVKHTNQGGITLSANKNFNNKGKSTQVTALVSQLHCILTAHKSFFLCFAGGFQAYWKFVFNLCKRFCPDFRTTPHAAIFETQFHEKHLAAYHDPTNDFDPYKNWSHRMAITAEELCSCFGIRGQQEPQNLTRSDFVFGIMNHGVFKGQKYVKLKEDHDGQKGNALSLMSHSLLKEHGGRIYLEVVDTGDEFSCYKLLYDLIHKYLPPVNLCKKCTEHRIFRQEATKGQLEVRTLVNDKIGN